MNRSLAIGLSIATIIGLILFFQGSAPKKDADQGTQINSPQNKRPRKVTLGDVPGEDSASRPEEMSQAPQKSEPTKKEKEQTKPKRQKQPKKILFERPRKVSLVNRWVPGMERYSRSPGDSVIEAKLELLKVDLNLDGQLVVDAIKDLNTIGLGFEIRIDPRVLAYLKKDQVEVSLRLRRISVRNALLLLLSVNPDLVYYFENDVLEITWEKFAPKEDAVEHVKRDELIPVEPLYGIYRKTLRERKVTLNFDKTPLSDIVSFIQDITNLNITASRDIDLEVPVTVDVRDGNLEAALKAILAKHGLYWIFENQTLKIVEKSQADPFWKDLEALEKKQKTAQAVLAESSKRSLNSATLTQALAFLQAEFQLNTFAARDYRWDGLLVVQVGDSVELICERMALLGDGDWELRQQSSGSYLVQWRQSSPEILAYCQGLIDEASSGISPALQSQHSAAFNKLLDKANDSKRKALQFKERALRLSSASELRRSRRVYAKRVREAASDCFKVWLASKADTLEDLIPSNEDVLKAYEIRQRFGAREDRLSDFADEYIEWISQGHTELKHPGLELLEDN